MTEPAEEVIVDTEAAAPAATEKEYEGDSETDEDKSSIEFSKKRVTKKGNPDGRSTAARTEKQKASIARMQEGRKKYLEQKKKQRQEQTEEQVEEIYQIKKQKEAKREERVKKVMRKVAQEIESSDSSEEDERVIRRLMKKKLTKKKPARPPTPEPSPEEEEQVISARDYMIQLGF